MKVLQVSFENFLMVKIQGQAAEPPFGNFTMPVP